MNNTEAEAADFRSDTFTMPDEAMRKIIHEAQVGNAGYGEDPSVNQLEKTLADFFECDDAIFLPSATMAGQIAISAWTKPGDMVLIEEYGHNYYFETGAMAAIAGVQAHLLSGTRGLLSADDIAARVVHPENHYARCGLIILENTSNFGGGTIYPQQTLDAIFHIGQSHSIPVHIDGARIWNVLAARSCSPAQLMPRRGSMSVCFSKGLGAPMGAALLGDKGFIHEARRIQLMLGGVMRQVGFMAAAALYAFENNRQRLKQDHENAHYLASGLANAPGIEIDLESVETNMVYARVTAGADRASELVQKLDARGVRCLNVGPLIRFVTSMLVDHSDCEKAISVFHTVLSSQ